MYPIHALPQKMFGKDIYTVAMAIQTGYKRLSKNPKNRMKN